MKLKSKYIIRESDDEYKIAECPKTETTEIAQKMQYDASESEVSKSIDRIEKSAKGSARLVSKKCTYEDYLEEHGRLTYRFSGVSMLPLLRQGKDFYTVIKKENKRCRKYDVVLYRRPPNHYVLHRIVEVRDTDYVILGDNCMDKEYGITDDDIIAVMTSFTRSGKEHSVNEMPYRIYSRVWYAMYPIRKLYKRFAIKIKGLIKKENKRN